MIAIGEPEACLGLIISSRLIAMNSTIVHPVSLPGGESLVTCWTDDTCMIHMLSFNMVSHVLTLPTRVLTFATLEARFYLVVQSFDCIVKLHKLVRIS